MYPEMTPERFLELKKNNPNFSEITAPILERELKKDIQKDFALKILSGEYEIKSAFQGWEDGEFKYEISTENGNVSYSPTHFKNGYVLCLVKKEK